MSELMLHKEYILSSPDRYRYVIKDRNDRVGCSGLTINYQEIEKDEWVTKAAMTFEHKDINLLIQILTEIEKSPLTDLE